MNLIISIIVLLSFLSNIRKRNIVSCTVDVNLSELEYLAGHLEMSECRRLVAALHYNTFELPESIAGAERKVDENIPCLRQLLHWNSSPGEGRGQTHENIEHRLRQINRNDLADWLGKTTFKQLGNDLDEAIGHPFAGQFIQDTEAQYPATLEPEEERPEEDPWLPIDTLLSATLIVLLISLIAVCLALLIHRIRTRCYNEVNNYSKIDHETGSGIFRTTDSQESNKIKQNRRNNNSPRLRNNKDKLRDKDSILKTKNKKRCCGVSCDIL